ncbi:hypothetical protein GWQ29_01570 [Aeromonas sp. 2HA2]|uniref:hypothetical protein n=1 Tax=Aeromonas sp. 2HA2 TaxID=2699194 RepID=UPI0023DD92EA|nr:hypothetical protein [Aeromonas sp. 2HA2]MDF2408130.1 hypothetical protein [Aeromonas sp. 2HA2]
MRSYKINHVQDGDGMARWEVTLFEGASEVDGAFYTYSTPEEGDSAREECERAGQHWVEAGVNKFELYPRMFRQPQAR